MEERKTIQYENNQNSLGPQELMITPPEETTPETQDSIAMVCEEEEEDEEDEEFDFDDVLVLPAEGLLIKHNEEEVRMLFFYVKPSIGKTSSYKAVTELRIPRKHFLRIAGEIQQTMEEYNDRGHKEMQLPMFG